MATKAPPFPATRGDDRMSVVVTAPSANAGLTQALRSTYRAAGLPDDLLRLLAKLG
jgi:hypothetical protein